MFYHDEFERVRKEAITAAKELMYPEEVIKKIEAAKTEWEITTILKLARLAGDE